MRRELDDLMGELQQLVNSQANRASRVKTFQECVWRTIGVGGGGDAERVLRDLAYDLDFYEADEHVRAESPELYGDVRLEKEIEAALGKLRLLGQRRFDGGS
jgi:hypothetical protein